MLLFVALHLHLSNANQKITHLIVRRDVATVSCLDSKGGVSACCKLSKAALLAA